MRAGATEGRQAMDRNMDSVADANFAKIDVLSLPMLDQLDEALNLIEAQEGARPDLARYSQYVLLLPVWDSGIPRHSRESGNDGS